ncbi:MAG TPA: dihydroxy-acid dehydratase, partial [Streptosporangiaceae bacterium]
MAHAPGTMQAADGRRRRGSGSSAGAAPPIVLDGIAKQIIEQLRSHGWFGGDRSAGLRTFSHRSRMRGLGYAGEEHLGKPVIAILNTWSDINPCHMHLRERAQQVKRGVWQA